MPALRRKAAETYKEADLLFRSRRWSGAANRAYYSLYQALVAEFVSRGKQPRDYSAPDPKYPEKWPHHTIANNCGDVGVTGEESELVSQAQALRLQADYKRDPPAEWAVESVLSSLPDLLDGLGVRIAA